MGFSQGQEQFCILAPYIQTQEFAKIYESTRYIQLLQDKGVNSIHLWKLTQGPVSQSVGSNSPISEPLVSLVKNADARAYPKSNKSKLR